jgi:hypothetical protein
MSTVRLFRLNSGEEVLAKVIEPPSSNERTWLVKNPAVLLPMGNGKLGMAPWLPYCETDNLSLPEDAIAFTVEPKTQLSNDYNQNFGSGLVVPDKSVETAPPFRLIAD